MWICGYHILFCLYASCLCKELFMSTSHWTNWLSVFHSSEHDIMAKHCMKLSSSFQQVSISQYLLCYEQNEIVFVVNTSKECILIEIPDSIFWFLSMKGNDDKPDFTILHILHKCLHTYIYVRALLSWKVSCIYSISDYIKESSYHIF